MGYRLGIIGLCVLGLSACGVNHLMIDDAYHWEEKSSYKVQPSTPAVNSTPGSSSQPSNLTQSSEPNEPVLEFLNVQDTTITVRIKR